MTNYVDVFVVPVPESNIEAYRKQAELFVKGLARAWCTLLHRG
jgi:uncharacterized protein YbaA (DUF1428 family)